jgi:actin-related protein 3
MNSARDNPAVVIDNGSGFTKVGFAGEAAPQSTFQTAIGRSIRSSKKEKESPLDDLNFVSGEISSAHPTAYTTHPPIKHGVVEDWDGMEQVWQTCFFDKLRCNPEDHFVFLTEPPLNDPANREQTAEIMFESFNVPAMNISVQAILSLAASWTNEKVSHREMTGIVVDSGFGATHIVPVVDGRVIPNCIKQMNIGGRDVTAYVQKMMRDRKEPTPHGMGVSVARSIKENFTYTCPSVEKEYERFDSNPEKYFKLYEGIHNKTGERFSCNVQYERFLAPEIVLNPKVCEFEKQKNLILILLDK